jgi:hypothetical protein
LLFPLPHPRLPPPKFRFLPPRLCFQSKQFSFPLCVLMLAPLLPFRPITRPTCDSPRHRPAPAFACFPPGHRPFSWTAAVVAPPTSHVARPALLAPRSLSPAWLGFLLAFLRSEHGASKQAATCVALLRSLA